MGSRHPGAKRWNPASGAHAFNLRAANMGLMSLSRLLVLRTGNESGSQVERLILPPFSPPPPPPSPVLLGRRRAGQGDGVLARRRPVLTPPAAPWASHGQAPTSPSWPGPGRLQTAAWPARRIYKHWGGLGSSWKAQGTGVGGGSSWAGWVGMTDLEALGLPATLVASGPGG